MTEPAAPSDTPAETSEPDILTGFPRTVIATGTVRIPVDPRDAAQGETPRTLLITGALTGAIAFLHDIKRLCPAVLKIADIDSFIARELSPALLPARTVERRLDDAIERGARLVEDCEGYQREVSRLRADHQTVLAEYERQTDALAAAEAQVSRLRQLATENSTFADEDWQREIAKPPTDSLREAARRAVESQRNDKRTEAEIVADGVKFIMGLDGDEGTELAAAQGNKAGAATADFKAPSSGSLPNTSGPVSAASQDDAYERLANDVTREVAELHDLTSPDDWPEAMIVTDAELRAIVKACAIRAMLSAPPDDAYERCARLVEQWQFPLDARDHDQHERVAKSLAAAVRALRPLAPEGKP